MLNQLIKLTITISFLLGAAFAVSSSIAKTPALAPHIGHQALIKLKNSDQVYQIETNLKLDQFIQQNQPNQSIEYIEPNYTYQASIEPTDVYYPQQIYLSSIKANRAWDYTVGSPNIIIAIIDSGVYIDHPDLKDNIWTNPGEIPNNNIDDDSNGYIDDYYGWDFVENLSDPSPKFGSDYSFLGMNHGTIISGVAAARGNNDIGVAGITWSSKIMPLRVLAGDGTGNTVDVARAIDYAIQNKADIINLSFVGEGKSKTLEDAIKRAYQAGVLIIAAAGNEIDQGVNMSNSPRYPVCHDGPSGENWVVGVASVDKNDHLASFSNYGDCVDLIAPGVGIFNTLFQSEEQPRYHRLYGGYWSGTSVSAPQISGLAALLKSYKPTLSLLEIQKLLFNSTDNIDNSNMLYIGQLGYGKINASKLMISAEDTTSLLEAGIDKIIISPSSSGGPRIMSYKINQPYTQFFADEKTKTFGANAVVYDLNHDGSEEVIVSAAKGDSPWVKVFDIQGKLKTEFLAFDPNFTGGVKVDIGDIDNDNLLEIIAVPQTGFEPIVKIFDTEGKLKKEFYAFNKFFKNGLAIAVGDVNGDGYDEIAVGTGPGTPATVKIFNSGGLVLSQFMPYDPNYMSGVTLAVGNLDSNKRLEIVTGTLAGGGPHVRVFDFDGRVKNEFLSYHPLFRGGVNVAVGDVDGNGVNEIITGAGPGGGPHVRIFGTNNKVLAQFMAYDENFRGGVNVTSGK